MQIHVSAGPEDHARILDALTLVVCSDPPGCVGCFAKQLHPFEGAG